MSQNRQILYHFRNVKPTITQLEATLNYGITRLAPRIGELKDSGFDITPEIIENEEYPGAVGNYAVYHFKEKE